MSALALLFFASSALANWDSAWLKTAEVQWQTQSPSAKDEIGISVYCGFTSFSKRTRIMVTVQNRTDHAVCLSPNSFLLLSESVGQRVRESTPPLRSRVARAVRRTHLSKMLKEQPVSKDVSCRELKSSDPWLPDFKIDEKTALCEQSQVKIMGGDVFEASYDFSLPLVDLDEFEITIPSDCEKSGSKKQSLEFHCKAEAR